MTPFKLLIIATGLSQREVADYLETSTSQIDKMSRGTRTAGEDYMARMRALYAIQQSAARQLLERIATTSADTAIEIGLASDDYEAQSLGWPSIGAQAGSIAMAVASTDRTFKVVPRGSTPATAGAADAHEKARPHERPGEGQTG